MVETINIRSATDKDLRILENMAQQLEMPKQKGYFARCLEEQAQGHREIFIISSAGNDAGYVIFNRVPRYKLYDTLDIPEIQDLNILPLYRKKGLATVLIKYCENLARSEEYQHMGISVGLHSAFGAAQRLYCKLDYYPDGYGVTYDRQPVLAGEMRPVDDLLCLMMIKDL